MIIDNPKRDIADFVSKLTGCKFSGGYSALAYVKDEEIRCAAIFDVWRGRDIEISAAGYEFSKSFLVACGRYVFFGLKCHRATLRTRSDHYKAIETCVRLGARIEGVQREYFVGADAVMLGITRRDFKYGRF